MHEAIHGSKFASQTR